MTGYRYIILDWDTPSKDWFTGSRCPNVRVLDAAGSVVVESMIVWSGNIEDALTSHGYAGVVHDPAAQGAYDTKVKEDMASRLLRFARGEIDHL